MLLRLTSPTLPFWVDVDLRDYDGRWVAVAELAGDKALGLGKGAVDAVERSIASLDSSTRRRLVSSARHQLNGDEEPDPTRDQSTV